MVYAITEITLLVSSRQLVVEEAIYSRTWAMLTYCPCKILRLPRAELH